MNTLALYLALQAIAAPRTPYGGEIIAYVWGRPLSTHPIHLATSADSTVQRALYERLYSVDESGKIVPNLAAALPSFDGNRVTIQLRPGLIAHDGTPVTAGRVAEWLAGFARADSRAAFVVLPIAGARERIAGREAPLRMMALDETTLLIELAHPYPELARLFAGPHAGIGVPGGAGTGPFKPADTAGGDIVLVPFLEHVEGRPFLDRVELRPLASRFGTTAIARKDRAALVFGTPDSGRSEPIRALGRPELREREVIVLSIGDRIAERKSALTAVLDAAMNRRRLAGRYLDGDARPAYSFLGAGDRPASREELRERVRAKLLVAKEARAGHRFAERVQLDLHRAGVVVVLERVAAEEIERLRMSKDYDLMLDVTLPDGPSSSRAIDRLHALSSIAASYGRTDVLTPDLFARFFRTGEEQRFALLEAFEEDLRREIGLVPLAARSPAISARDDLSNVTLSPDGSIDLAEAFLRESPP